MNKNLCYKKVLLGLSGGVDSTTAALLLKEQGYEVTGYYFDVLGNNKKGREEAEATANQLGIPLITEDVSHDFERIVIDNFCIEYMKGRTPNPCVICNPNIKFKKLIETADRIGAQYIATGHYCRIAKDEKTGNCYVMRGNNHQKDQSYMLYRLGQDVLRRLIFPLGEFEDKSLIREIAARGNMDNAYKKDSQEICFVDPSDNYADFIKRKITSSGDVKFFAFNGVDAQRSSYDGYGCFVDKEGNVLGKHQGILNYTVGQRKGLGIALGRPAFVTKIDYQKNQVVIGENKDLFTTRVTCTDYCFCDDGEYDGMKVDAKIRYAAQPAEAILKIEKNKIIAAFKEPQRAPAPGQSMVFYMQDRVIGGGFIE